MANEDRSRDVVGFVTALLALLLGVVIAALLSTESSYLLDFMAKTGDFFGGFLNPIIAAVAVWFLYKQLRLTQIEIDSAIQSFAASERSKEYSRLCDSYSKDIYVLTDRFQFGPVDDYSGAKLELRLFEYAHWIVAYCEEFPEAIEPFALAYRDVDVLNKWAQDLAWQDADLRYHTLENLFLIKKLLKRKRESPFKRYETDV